MCPFIVLIWCDLLGQFETILKCIDSAFNQEALSCFLITSVKLKYYLSVTSRQRASWLSGTGSVLRMVQIWKSSLNVFCVLKGRI